MKLLLFNYYSYIRNDLLEEFARRGFQCQVMDHKFKDKNHDDEFLFSFKNLLKEGGFDFVFSVNYYPLLAQACCDLKMKYISWSYDCPLDVRNIEETLGYSTNYVFLYDNIQYQKYREQGFNNVYHLPLAVNTKRLDKLVVKSKHLRDYGDDISFIGKLYKYVYPEITEFLPEYLQGYLDGICESQLNVYGCYFLEQMITEDLMRDLNLIWQKKAGFHMIKEELSYACAAQITYNERTRLLEMLSQLPGGNRVSLYSEDKLGIKGVQEKGAVNYHQQMPYVFKTSKINLNMSLKCIPSGIPLRVIDIMGCGGFLLTNFQQELLDYFEPGVDLAVYTSLEEALDLADYYLKNDGERRKIAENGYKKVKRDFTYADRLDKILEISL